MKKVYSKPDIFFEDFSLSTNIAAGGCEKKPEPSNDQICGYVLWGAAKLFTSAEYGCKSILEDNGKNKYNNLCYHVPYESFNVFNS